ncbi:hypothetical protein RFI_17462, partial [Reticulomyxa filosa]
MAQEKESKIKTKTARNNGGAKRKPLYPGWGSGEIAYVGTFQVRTVNEISRSDLNKGDKIVLPASALTSIQRLRLPFPLIFEIRPSSSVGNTHSNLRSCSFTQSELQKKKKKKTDEACRKEYRKRIEKVYDEVNPSKKSEIGKLMRKYSQDWYGLYVKICKKYEKKAEPPLSQDRFSLTVKSTLHRKLSAFKQYCGVMDFSSPVDHHAYIPQWMMNNLHLVSGDSVEIQSQFSIPK